jgi:hypothetical protein
VEKVVDQLKVYWEKLKISERVIFISFFSGFISMFLNWSYGSFFPQNGFTQLTIFLLCFWVYPLFRLVSGKKINRNIGMGCSFVALVLVSFYIYSKNVEIFGGFMNLAGIGPWIFLLSSLALGAGVYQSDLEYQKKFNSDPNSNVSKLLPPS